MDLFEGPRDIFGMGIYHSLSSKMENNPKYRKFIENLEENIVLELDYYSLMMKFQEESLEIKKEYTEKPSVVIKIKIQDFLDIIDEKGSIITKFLGHKLVFKKGLKKIFKVYKIFSTILN